MEKNETLGRVITKMECCQYIYIRKNGFKTKSTKEIPLVDLMEEDNYEVYKEINELFITKQTIIKSKTENV